MAHHVPEAEVAGIVRNTGQKRALQYELWSRQPSSGLQAGMRLNDYMLTEPDTHV